MKTRAREHWYLPLLITGIAVILFSTAGVARMMGWSPIPADDYGDMLTHNRTALPRTPGEARAPARCPECGVIVSMREIETREENSGPGTAGGAAAGNRDGAGAPSARRSEIIVRMADGSSRVINAANPAKWRPGERLIVIGDVGPPSR